MSDEQPIGYAKATETTSAPAWLVVAAGLGLGLGLLWLGCGLWGLFLGMRQGFDDNVLSAVYGGIPVGVALSAAELRLLSRRSTRTARMAGLLWLGIGFISTVPMFAFTTGSPRLAWVVFGGWIVLCLLLGAMHLVYAFGRSRPASVVTTEE